LIETVVEQLFPDPIDQVSRTFFRAARLAADRSSSCERRTWRHFPLHPPCPAPGVGRSGSLWPARRGKCPERQKPPPCMVRLSSDNHRGRSQAARSFAREPGHSPLLLLIFIGRQRLISHNSFDPRKPLVGTLEEFRLAAEKIQVRSQH
jgi:hypothetical protein